MTTPNDDTANELLGQGRALRALARSVLRGTDGADDVVQEAFANELATRKQADNRAGWLARVVQNLARRRLRELARRRQRHQQAGLLQPPAAAPAADDVLAKVEVHRLVADAVLQLGEPYRRALVLRFWHDLPPRAIARRLGMPVSTVKTHLQRGLAELRQRLDRRAGERRTWLAALVPIAHPELVAGAVGGAHAGSITLAALVAMNSKLVMFALATGLCVGVLLWQPWSLPPLPAVDQAAAGHVDLAHADRGDARSGASPADTAAAGAVAAAEPVRRTAAGSVERTCTVVGRIVIAGDRPVPGARIRLVNLWESESTPPLSAAAAADGTFALAVPRPDDWIPYSFALADATGWAVREKELGADVQKTIANDRLDLGTLRLERGVAVAGRVLEPDGAPLRSRARLLGWDPRESSSPRMYSGRTFGFAEPGGQFALEDRLAASAGGIWMLAAVSPSGVGWAELAFAAGQDHLDPVEIRLLPGGGVDVHVVDADGQPIADALVQAVPYFKPIGLSPMWEPLAGAGTPALPEVEALFVRRSDAEGHARFANLPLRQHPRIRDANTQQRRVEAIIVVADEAGYVVNSATVDPAVDAAPVTITLTKPRRVAFHGVVATADGTKLAGVTVKLNGGDQACTTDAAGRYELSARSYQGNSAPFLIEGGDVPLTFAQAEIPAVGDAIEHDFIVERRAPVSGCVVDQFGAPVAGVALHLGVAGGVHYASVPERTGADGRFAFPDAVMSQSDLWVQPPEPTPAWRLEPSRPLVRRDGEVVTLQRFEGPLVDLTVAVVDGRNGAPVSPTKVELQRLHGNTVDYDTPSPQITLALGAATAAHLRPGSYRATVNAGDGLRAVREFMVDADEPAHTERVELWPAVAVVGTVDASALSPDELAARSGDTRHVLLDSQKEESYAVDASGKRLNLTPNTAAIEFGGEMTFRLERVTPNVPLRLYVPGNDLFGEVWFCAQPGADAHVTLRLLPSGRIAFAVPAGWPPGSIEVDHFDCDAWRPLRDWRRGTDGANGAPKIACPAGELRWRLRLFPRGGGAIVERTGTATVRVGATTEVRVD